LGGILRESSDGPHDQGVRFDERYLEQQVGVPYLEYKARVRRWLGSTPAERSNRMSAEVNKALVRRLYEEVFNKRNLAVADELLSSESINHDDPHAVGRVGSGALKGAVQMLTAAFPDFHMTIEDMVAEGDKVVVRVTASGTHQGAFMGIAPTGKRFTQQQMHLIRVVDGKVTEHWDVRDDLGMLQQLGVMPAPGR
jgi:steroid delta-isomerase-like uncharacterized protein